MLVIFTSSWWAPYWTKPPIWVPSPENTCSFCSIQQIQHYHTVSPSDPATQAAPRWEDGWSLLFFHFIAGKIYPKISKCALQIKKAQEMGSNELLRSPVPQKQDVLLNSESVHSTSAMSTLKLHFGITNRAFQKTSEAKNTGFKCEQSFVPITVQKHWTSFRENRFASVTL